MCNPTRSRARERILEGSLGAAASGECVGLPYFDRLSPPEKLVGRGDVKPKTTLKFDVWRFDSGKM